MRKWLVAVLSILTLTACGGDNGSSTAESNPFSPSVSTDSPTVPNTPTTPGNTQTPIPSDPRLARMSLASSQYAVRSDNSDTATLTVTALDQNNAALAGVSMSIRASAGLLNTASVTTGADGTAAFTFRAGPERSNQVVTVTAASGGMAKSIPIQITGTTLNLDASRTSMLQHDPQGIALSGQILDAAGRPLFGEEVTLSSIAGNTLSATDNLGRQLSGPSIVLTTNVNGEFRATFSGDLPAEDTVSVLGCGVQRDVSIRVMDSNFAFVEPAQETAVPEGNTLNLVVRWENGSGPVGGQILTFAASHGRFAGESRQGMIQATTDAQGQATVAYIASDLATPAIVQVTSAGLPRAEAFLALNVLAVNPNRLDVQAFPAVIAPSIGTSISTATIIATVRDASNNPVREALVNFQLLDGPGAGETIFPVTAYTDASGKATTTFTAGSLTSAQNGVRIRAIAGNHTDDITFTIGQTAARVVIGTTNELEPIERDGLEVAFGMPVTVLVTDNNGNPIAGQRVSLGIYPLRFHTGHWERIVVAGDGAYSIQIVTGTFENEDRNRNGILDASEDGAIGEHLNRPAYYLDFDKFRPLPPLPADSGLLNNMLDPGNVASIPAEVITDENGLASYKVIYAKSYARWIDLELSAATTVSGSETRTRLEVSPLPWPCDEEGHPLEPVINSPFGDRGEL